jgi:hypothetical protein
MRQRISKLQRKARLKSELKQSSVNVYSERIYYFNKSWTNMISFKERSDNLIPSTEIFDSRNRLSRCFKIYTANIPRP